MTKDYVNTPLELDLLKHDTDKLAVWLNGNTRGRRNNNPCNIVYNVHNRFLGLIADKDRKDERFCEFQALVYGVRAVIVVLSNYRRRGVMSLRDIITNWAPPTENKTDRYLQFVLDQMATTFNEETGEIYYPNPDEYMFCSLDSMYSFRLYELVRAMCLMESGLDLSVNLYCKAFRMVDFDHHPIFVSPK